MNRRHRSIIAAAVAALFVVAAAGAPSAGDIVRPEEIKSKRQVVYNQDTYAKLTRLWQAYNDAYPSEYAYANWMYAARYAGDEQYSALLNKGLERYPDNPTLLYLKGIEQHGAVGDAENRTYLERAVSLDPGYDDPWFALVTEYMEDGDEEQLNLSLRHLLETGAIADEVMDYNYNVLISLDSNAILITNGDNDTYPGWVLTRILGVRPDVNIVNRSLLNTEWYPGWVIGQGAPRFISAGELTKLRESISQSLKRDNLPVPPGGPFGDTLILKLVESATRASRPVYFAKTMFHTDKLKSTIEQGLDLGLATLVTPATTPYAKLLERVFRTWLQDFRTSGLKGWHMCYAPEADGGRFIVTNYASVMVNSLDALKEHAPQLRTDLFNWYLENVQALLSEDTRSGVAVGWCCDASDVRAVDRWCRSQGVTCPDSERP